MEEGRVRAFLIGLGAAALLVAAAIVVSVWRHEDHV